MLNKHYHKFINTCKQTSQHYLYEKQTSWELSSLYIELKSDTRKTQLPRNIIFAGWNFCKSSIICHNESFFFSQLASKKGFFISFKKLDSSITNMEILKTFKSTSIMFINLKESWSFLQNQQKFLQNWILHPKESSPWSFLQNSTEVSSTRMDSFQLFIFKQEQS